MGRARSALRNAQMVYFSRETLRSRFGLLKITRLCVKTSTSHNASAVGPYRLQKGYEKGC